MRNAKTAAAIAVALWLAFLTYQTLWAHANQLRALQGVSAGMPRKLVVQHLGQPLRARPDDRYVEGGELLVYELWQQSVPEFYVILGKDGKVAMVIYPSARFAEQPLK